ncbi:N-acetylglucosamine kinase [Alkalihalobacillus sp. TS-13]|uniref:N-acetylglucosamine kinase n=1 Tax=Alkalihalobacillus sp. TS-13 TaxID=2842455 RepID=UPI001C88C695|nr:BadF/BadG/BcrA/BcrD ATPase family protein [Alkalihalobacillus sp. TS-13]
MYYLGIDGGGSKTTVALVDDRGELIACHHGGPSNPVSVTLKEIEQTIDDLFGQLKRNHAEQYSQIKSVCAGIAGTENSYSKDELRLLLKSKFPEGTTVQLCHDALTALYSGTNGEPGIVNIAGTGSITFGVTADKNVVRSGGWGYLLDHTGSGFGIGRLALQKVFEAYDGFTQPTILTDFVLKRFGISSPPGLISVIYGTNESRSRIASVCEDVFAAARLEDKDAVDIVKQAADEIAKSISHIIHNHFKELDQTKVVLTGSVFKSRDLLLPLLQKNLPDGVQLILPKSPPVVGSIIESYQTMHGTCPEDFVKNLHESFARGD